MSEHTPLTEAERELLRDWWDSESESDTADTMLANLDATVERILAARTSTATADDAGCWQPCDPDCEVGPIHCEAVHLPSHKAKAVLHTAECVATADTGLREWVRSLPDKIREYADIFEGQQREDIARAATFVEFAMPFALDAPGAPTADTGARDE